MIERYAPDVLPFYIESCNTRMARTGRTYVVTLVSKVDERSRMAPLIRKYWIAIDEGSIQGITNLAMHRAANSLRIYYQGTKLIHDLRERYGKDSEFLRALSFSVRTTHDRLAIYRDETLQNHLIDTYLKGTTKHG